MLEESSKVEEHYAAEELDEETSVRISKKTETKKASKEKDGKSTVHKQQNTIWYAS